MQASLFRAKKRGTFPQVDGPGGRDELGQFPAATTSLLVSLYWHTMGGTFGGLPAAFVVNLGGRDMAMAQQFLDLSDILALFKEQGSCGRAG